MFSGLIIGRAIHVTGLGNRLSRTFLTLAPSSHSGSLTALVFAGLALSFFMPSSMGRVAMIIPFTVLIADQLGMPRESPSRDVLVVTAALGAYLPSAAILPANIPNMILASAASSLYGISFSYAEYLVATFPTIGIGKFVVVAGTGLILSTRAASRCAEPAPVIPARSDEKRLMIILSVAVLLWATDAVHGINAAWIGLAAAIFCLLPSIGVLNERAFNHDLSWTVLIHTAGIISLGAVIASSGVGDSLGRALAAVAPFLPDHGFWNFMVLTVLMTLICVATTTPGLPAVATPLAASLAEASGLPLRAVLLLQALAFIFPFQGAPLVFAFHTTGVSTRTAMKALGAVTLGSLLIIAPLTYVWWRMIGILP